MFFFFKHYQYRQQTRKSKGMNATMVVIDSVWHGCLKKLQETAGVVLRKPHFRIWLFHRNKSPLSE